MGGHPGGVAAPGAEALTVGGDAIAAGHDDRLPGGGGRVGDDGARRVDPDLPRGGPRHPRGVRRVDRALVDDPPGARVRLAELLDPLHVGRQVDLAAADGARHREVEQAGVGDRLEERARQLAEPVRLVGAGADLRRQLAGGLERRRRHLISPHGWRPGTPVAKRRQRYHDPQAGATFGAIRAPAEASMDTLVDGLTFPEAPRWRDGKLWFSDFYTHRVLTVDPRGTLETVVEVPQRPSGLGWTPDGALLVVSMLDRRLLRVDGGKLRVVADLSTLATGPCNDMVVDAAGRAYVGNFGFDRHRGEPPRTTCLARIDPDGAVTRAADELSFPNGTIITPDGRTLIVAETLAHRG